MSGVASHAASFQASARTAIPAKSLPSACVHPAVSRKRSHRFVKSTLYSSFRVSREYLTRLCPAAARCSRRLRHCAQLHRTCYRRTAYTSKAVCKISEPPSPIHRLATLTDRHRLYAASCVSSRTTSGSRTRIVLYIPHARARARALTGCHPSDSPSHRGR